MVVKIKSQEELNDIIAKIEKIISKFDFVKSHSINTHLSTKYEEGEWSDEISDYESIGTPNSVFPVIKIVIIIKYNDSGYNIVTLETLRGVMVTSGRTRPNVLIDKEDLNVETFLEKFEEFLENREFN